MDETKFAEKAIEHPEHPAVALEKDDSDVKDNVKLDSGKVFNKVSVSLVSNAIKAYEERKYESPNKDVFDHKVSIPSVAHAIRIFESGKKSTKVHVRKRPSVNKYKTDKSYMEDFKPVKLKPVSHLQGDKRTITLREGNKLNCMADEKKDDDNESKNKEELVKEIITKMPFPEKVTNRIAQMVETQTNSLENSLKEETLQQKENLIEKRDEKGFSENLVEDTPKPSMDTLMDTGDTPDVVVAEGSKAIPEKLSGELDERSGETEETLATDKCEETIEEQKTKITIDSYHDFVDAEAHGNPESSDETKEQSDIMVEASNETLDVNVVEPLSADKNDKILNYQTTKSTIDDFQSFVDMEADDQTKNKESAKPSQSFVQQRDSVPQPKQTDRHLNYDEKSMNKATGNCLCLIL